MFRIDLDNFQNIEEIQECENEKIFSPYVNVQSAKGCYLFSSGGKKYLDLTSNKENQPFGYNYEIKAGSYEFIDSELLKSNEAIKLSRLIENITGLEKTVFSSSKVQSHKILNDIITEHIENTGKSKILTSCSPKTIKQYKFNNSENIPINNESIFRTLFTKSVGAVIVEIVQTDNEINIADEAYLSTLKEWCHKYNAILVFDVSTVSPLRTGTSILNYDSSIKPDVLLLSAGLANGEPFSALSLDKVVRLTKDTSEGCSNYVYGKVINLINSCTEKTLKEVISANSAYMVKKLEELTEFFITIVDVQSYGMLLTVTVDGLAYDLAQKCFENGVIIDVIDKNTIKLSPPYNIGKEEIEILIKTFYEALDSISRYNRL